MKDNDLLVTELYKDPSEDMVTALSVYLTPKTSKWKSIVFSVVRMFYKNYKKDNDWIFCLSQTKNL